MEYFRNIGERIFLRVIIFGILLHAMICFMAMMGLIFIPYYAYTLVSDIRLADTLMQEAEKIPLPLVNRDKEARHIATGRYLCWVAGGNGEKSHSSFSSLEIIPILRDEPPTGLVSLRFYDHPALKGRFDAPLLTEVPSPETRNAVVRNYRGSGIVKSWAIVALLIVLEVAGIFIAIRAYFLIKGRRRGPRRR